MKELLLLIVFCALLLSACGGVQPATAGTIAAQPTVENTISSAPAVEGAATAEAPVTSAVTDPAAPATPDSAPASQAIVERWIAANQNRDAEALLSLYADNFAWLDCSTSALCDAYYLNSMKIDVTRDFSNPRYKVEVQSYLVTTSGRFAALQAIFSDPNMGTVSTPLTVILEIKNGMIKTETWYYAAP